MQFLDRAFYLLETIVSTDGTRNTMEKGMNLYLGSTCGLVFQQLSTPLFDKCLDKLFRWMTSNIILTSLKTAATLCFRATEARPAATLAKFVPFFADRVLSLAAQHKTVDREDAEQADEKEVDDELIWYLGLLARTVKHAGAELLPYRETLVDVLRHTLPLVSTEASHLAGKLLRHTLRALADHYVADRSSVAPDVRTRLEAADPVALFEMRGTTTGAYTDPQIQWHIPSAAEMAFAEELVRTFFNPALERLRRQSSAESDSSATTSSSSLASRSNVTKHQLRLDLNILSNVARVGLPLLPESDLPTKPSSQTKVAMFLLPLCVTAPDAPAPTAESRGRRQQLCEVMHQAVHALLRHREDDTKSLIACVDIVLELLCVRGIREGKYNVLMQGHRLSKRFFQDLVEGKKHHLRSTLTSRVQLQHLRRLHKLRLSVPYHEQHAQLLQDLFAASTSAYAKVRVRAQQALSSAIVMYPQAKHDLFPRMLACIEPTAEHCQAKGALYLLSLRVFARLITRKWSYLERFLVKFAQLHQREKPSIQRLVARVQAVFTQEYRVTALEHAVPEPCFARCVEMLPAVAARRSEYEASAEQLAARNARCCAAFDAFVERLMEVQTSPQRHWKYELIFAGLLHSILRDDRTLPANVIQYALRAMANDLLPLRIAGLRTSTLVLALLKKPVRKQRAVMEADEDGRTRARFLADGEQPPTPPTAVAYGPRADNQLHLFRQAAAERPLTQAAYDATVFVDKNYQGWNIWSQTLQAYLPFRDQPPRALSEQDQLVLSVLQQEGFVPKLIAYLSEAKADGSVSSFHDLRADFFKGLFRNLGPPALALFKSELEALCAEAAADASSGEAAARQRCAGEMVGGLVRGSKHWPFAEVEAMWAWLVPLLEQTMAAVNNMSLGDWAAALRYCVYDKDPRRLYQLTDLLFQVRLGEEDTLSTFAQARSLAFLSTPLEEYSWRGQEAASALLTSLQPHLGHPYKLVRAKIARCLYVAMRSFWAPGADSIVSLAAAKESELGRYIQAFAASIEAERAKTEDDEAQKLAERLAKTLLSFLSIVFHDGSSPAFLPHLTTVLPLMLSISELSEDPELHTLAAQALSLASQVLLPTELVAPVLATLVQAAQDGSWHVRRRVLRYLQVMLFRNLFTASAEPVLELLMRLLRDEQVEVRDLASETLSGMVRCGMVTTEQLLPGFLELSQTAIRKRPRRRLRSAEGQPVAEPPRLTEEDRLATVARHSGLLGLQAVVHAFPYSVPDWMPNVLLRISEHVNDPEPLRATAKKALSEFWRTHQDMWLLFKPLFTEDQLAILTDLLISPSYYA